MSNKRPKDLWPVENLVNKTYPAGMTDMVQITIERFTGFELFNTRPYHNYETWSAGWRAKDAWGNTAQAEDLDDCLTILANKRSNQEE